MYKNIALCVLAIAAIVGWVMPIPAMIDATTHTTATTAPAIITADTDLEIQYSDGRFVYVYYGNRCKMIEFHLNREMAVSDCR